MSLKTKTLGTTDYRIAEERAEPWRRKWKAEFDRLRANNDALPDLTTFAVDHAYKPILENLEALRRAQPDDDAAYSAFLDKTAVALRTAVRLRQDGLHERWEAVADRMIVRRGLPLTKGTPEYLKFVEDLADCTIDAYSVHNRRSAGELDAEPKSETVRRALGGTAYPAPSGEKIIDLFEKWAAERLAKGEKRPDTVNQDRKVIEQFASFVGRERPVSSITPQEVFDYREALRALPPKWTAHKALKGLGMREAAAKARQLNLSQTAFTTVNKHLSTISPLFKWLAKQPAWVGLANPCNGLFHDKVKGKNPRPPFTTDNLNTILSSPMFTGFEEDKKEHLRGKKRAEDWRYWVPLICMFTGARLGEIAQLRTEDVRKERGVWFIHIRHDESTGQTTKSGMSRAAPVHSKLIEIGFLKFHEKQAKGGAGPIFPELVKNSRGQISANVGRFWGDYLKRIGVKDGSAKGGDGFGAHSFRHTMADRLRSEAELLDDQIEVALGHNQKTTTGGYGQLKQGTVTLFQSYFEAVSFEGVDFSVLA